MSSDRRASRDFEKSRGINRAGSRSLGIASDGLYGSYSGARSLRAVSEAPVSGDLRIQSTVYGRFRYSDLKEGAPPSESNVAVGEGEQSVVGDGDAMGVGAEIAQHVFRAAEGRANAMRSTVTLHVVSSLDGFIAKKDNSVSWMDSSDVHERGDTDDGAEIIESIA